MKQRGLKAFLLFSFFFFSCQFYPGRYFSIRCPTKSICIKELVKKFAGKFDFPGEPCGSANANYDLTDRTK